MRYSAHSLRAIQLKNLVPQLGSFKFFFYFAGIWYMFTSVLINYKCHMLVGHSKHTSNFALVYGFYLRQLGTMYYFNVL
uniref:Uncharacterized protein n=1 Tax=Pararge aegeria TaxID=116150 RepID=S4PGL5_9NEOP